MKIKNTFKLIVSLALPLSLGVIAGLYTAEAVPEWYTSLNKPSFNPPSFVFGPVWTILYLLLGFSFYLIWSKPKSKIRTVSMEIYFVQLLLNFAWSFLFFYFHTIGLALVDIIFLMVSIVIMLILFFKINPLASYLNIPYLLWVIFATALNAAYLNLN